jgi:hypothetical protein
MKRQHVNPSKVILSNVLLSKVILSNVLLSKVILSNVLLSKVLLSNVLLSKVILSIVIRLIVGSLSFALFRLKHTTRTHLTHSASAHLYSHPTNYKYLPHVHPHTQDELTLDELTLNDMSWLHFNINKQSYRKMTKNVSLLSKLLVS